MLIQCMHLPVGMLFTLLANPCCIGSRLFLQQAVRSAAHSSCVHMVLISSCVHMVFSSTVTCSALPQSLQLCLCSSCIALLRAFELSHVLLAAMLIERSMSHTALCSPCQSVLNWQSSVFARSSEFGSTRATMPARGAGRGNGAGKRAFLAAGVSGASDAGESSVGVVAKKAKKGDVVGVALPAKWSYACTDGICSACLSTSADPCSTHVE